MRHGRERRADDVHPPAQVGVFRHGFPSGFGKRRALRLPDGRDEEHVRAFGARGQRKVFRRPFFQDTRCKGTKALPMLDLQVHHRLHRGIPRIAENAPGAERTRAEFHPAVEPAYDFAGGEQSGDFIQQFRFLAESPMRHGLRGEQVRDLPV